MNWPVVIQRGPDLNQTLSGIQFDKFGQPTGQEIFICDDWAQGFEWAKTNGHLEALFVKSGTIITDWTAWAALLNRYPHKGLIAHVIWHPGQVLHLDDQCWFMNTKNFDVNDFVATTVTYSMPRRSDQNLHDDYTPLWIAPGMDTACSYPVTKFGQGLIARQLQNNQIIVNWNNQARDIKFFLYRKKLNLEVFQDYKNIAENQLWIFNNEPVSTVKKQRLLAPGSGLYWILNILDPATQEIQIVDVSRVQVKFCQELWRNWNGVDYGNFVWDFISRNKLVHYELDNPNLTPLERLKLKSKKTFVEYVNHRFQGRIGEDFADAWTQAKQNKTVDFCNDNLITWVLSNDVDKYDDIWCSNILNYKWTLLHTTVDEYKNFQAKLNETKNKSTDV
jgi:hypothetical protein